MSRALRLRELAQITDGSLLDLAVITPDGLESWKAETANTCNNGHSTIKLFVSICIGMLWDAGVLDLQEKAAALFPACWTAEMDPQWRDVTVENVLRHRIGFEAVHIDYEGETVCCGGEDSLITLFRTPLPHPQGSFYRYSDAAYYLLARIIEVKASMTLEAFIRRQLAQPMGFRDFAIASDPLGHTLGGGCMYARAGDMAKLGYLLACHGIWEGRRLLSDGYIQQMQANEWGLTHFRDSELYIKTGAYGQGIAFSCRRPLAAAWHRAPYAVRPVPDRNDVMLESLERLIAQENRR